MGFGITENDNIEWFPYQGELTSENINKAPKKVQENIEKVVNTLSKVIDDNGNIKDGKVTKNNLANGIIGKDKLDDELLNIVSSDEANVQITENEPNNPTQNQRWFDITNNTLKVYKNNKWVNYSGTTLLQNWISEIEPKFEIKNGVNSEKINIINNKNKITLTLDEGGLVVNYLPNNLFELKDIEIPEPNLNENTLYFNIKTYINKTNKIFPYGWKQFQGEDFNNFNLISETVIDDVFGNYQSSIERKYLNKNEIDFNLIKRKDLNIFVSDDGSIYQNVFVIKVEDTKKDSLFEIKRYNSGAFHPNYNPNGSALFYEDGQIKKYSEVSDNYINSKEDCLNTDKIAVIDLDSGDAASLTSYKNGDVNQDSYKKTGWVESNKSGRDDNRFCDYVYSDQLININFSFSSEKIKNDLIIELSSSIVKILKNQKDLKDEILNLKKEI